MTSLDHIRRIAEEILRQGPGPVVKYRLLRDVLKVPAGAAKKVLQESFLIRELAGEQREDGGWGPFHSRRALSKLKIPSTEVGVERAIALGLDYSHPLLRRTARYIKGIMKGRIRFPDYHEKNDRWSTGERMFLASTLSLIRPGDPILNRDRDLWFGLAERTFRSGVYNESDEIDAHRELTGATVKDSYLVVNNRYALNILGSKPGLLNRRLERTLLTWLWTRPDGIGYLGVPLATIPTGRNAGRLDRWLASLEMLGRLFPSWIYHAKKSIDWLWAQRQKNGWDFGPRPVSSSFLPLSNHWRTPRVRLFDWTTRILILLTKFCG
jgi:hypothetical protein